jgi:hypothetical protein
MVNSPFGQALMIIIRARCMPSGEKGVNRYYSMGYVKIAREEVSPVKQAAVSCVR